MDINGKGVVMTSRKKGRKMKAGKLYLYHVSKPLMKVIINVFFFCHAVNQVPSYRLGGTYGYQIKYTLGPVYSFWGVRL